MGLSGADQPRCAAQSPSSLGESTTPSIGLQTLPPDRLITGATVGLDLFVLNLEGSCPRCACPKGLTGPAEARSHLARSWSRSRPWYWSAGWRLGGPRLWSGLPGVGGLPDGDTAGW